MVFIRSRQHEVSIGHRFRSAEDGFVVRTRGSLVEVRVIANGERTADLFHALAEHFPPAVSVALMDARTGLRWSGAAIALPDVRDSIARLQRLLAIYGGVEWTLFTAQDQLTLTKHLTLYAYSTTERWVYLARGKGLEEQPREGDRSWRLRDHEFPPAPELTNALRHTVERLGLDPEAE